MSSSTRTLLTTSCLTFLLYLFCPTAIAQTFGKIPREVIDQAAAHGTVLVLVGLKVPWQMESTLTEDGIRSQRKAISSVQDKLLVELTGRKHKVIRRYPDLPGITLEVGADALAELAWSNSVVNVLLDHPPADEISERNLRVGQLQSPLVDATSTVSDKVPWQLFTRAANDGTVLILAGLRVPWQKEDQLSEELVALQRKAILNAQQYILAELAGTRYKVMRLYSRIPGIALRVGSDALKVLEKSPAVTNVLPDRPIKASR
jgi:hypothetical protein